MLNRYRCTDQECHYFHCSSSNFIGKHPPDCNIVYGLQELEDRYNRLRLEVQLAADKGEAASEAELVRRAMAKEKTVNAVKGFFGSSR